MPVLAGTYEFEISAEVILIFKCAAMSFGKACKLFALIKYLAAEGSRMRRSSNSTIISFLCEKGIF